MKSHPTYKIAKKLENQLLDYLNTTQPFKYFDTFNNMDLPMVPYYPSLYRYSQFDLYNEYITLELKSRTEPIEYYTNNLLDTSKIINNHSIFLYTYQNKHEVINDLHFIPYDKNVFDAFYIQNTKNNCELYIIPKTEHTFKKLDTPTPHTHQININYTDDYKDKHTDLIACDISNYKSTFGFYNL